MNIVAMPRKETMRIDRNLHQRVAWLAFTEGWGSLPAQAQNLSRLNSGRNCYVERSTVRQCQPLGRAVDRIEKVDRKTVVQVRPTCAPRFPCLPPEQLRKKIVRSAKSAKPERFS